jgi:hypothetical protein
VIIFTVVHRIAKAATLDYSFSDEVEFDEFDLEVVKFSLQSQLGVVIEVSSLLNH